MRIDTVMSVFVKLGSSADSRIHRGDSVSTSSSVHCKQTFAHSDAPLLSFFCFHYCCVPNTALHYRRRFLQLRARRQQAALVLQRHVRGTRGRNETVTRRSAVLLLQRMARGHSVRTLQQAAVSAHRSERKRAAVTLQVTRQLQPLALHCCTARFCTTAL